MPSFINRSAIPEKRCGKGTGYRHMCRSQAKGVYEDAIMESVEYAWRLDDDSLLLRPINYDVFEFMRRRRHVYGYQNVQDDWCTEHLWPTVDR